MTSGHSDDPARPVPSFADVMSAYSLDTARSSRRRRWGRRRGGEGEQALETPPQWASVPAQAAASAPVELPPPREAVEEPEDEDEPAGAAAVRPYAWTRGRTKSGFDLAVETLLSTTPRGRERLAVLPVEHRSVAQLCEQTRSVAEVAALLAIPLGVARVLLGDMAGLGLVCVHQTTTSAGRSPDLALMERVLSGLRRL